jgi:hypothetical protein
MIASQEYSVASGAIISILKSNPLHAETLHLKSLLYATDGDFPEALASAIILTAVDPMVARYWVLRGELELEVRFKHAALRSFNEAAELGFPVEKFLLAAAGIACSCRHCQ